MVGAVDLDNYYRVPPDLRDLNYDKFVEYGEIEISNAVDYNSHNTNRLDISSMQVLLRKLDFLKSITHRES